MFAIVLAMALQTSPGVGPTPPPLDAPGSGARIVKPVWMALPTTKMVKQYYPEEARKQRISGKAVLRCSVKDDGTLTACTATDEAPLNMGFGQAALELSTIFQMKPQTAEGLPVGGGVVRIPIVFQLP